MDGPRVDIQDGMLNASKATSGALPYMQLLVSWWTGVPGLPRAKHLGSAKSGGSLTASQWDVWQFFNKWQVSFQMKNYDLGSWKRTLVNDFWGLRFLVPFATQMKFPYQGLALDHVVLYRIAALKSPKSLHRFFIDSSIRYGDHVSEEKQTALTFPIFCTIQERSGLGTWLLQCGLPDPCADLVTDKWTLDEASSNPKVVSAFCWALFSIAKDGAN